MERVEVLPYRDISIIYTNLEGLSINEVKETMAEASLVIKGYPLKSVYSLINMTDMRFNSELRGEMDKIGKINAPYVKATAAVGLTSIMKLMTKVTIKITGRKIALFSDVEAGKEWLYQVHLGNN